MSGEALSGTVGYGLDEQTLDSYARQIVEVTTRGVEVAIVIGGGNIFRGLTGAKSGFDRVKGDQMGMLATVINSLALENAINSCGGQAKVYTATNMSPIGEFYNRDNVIKSLSQGVVCILAGGSGNPFFTTDTAAALRSVEIGADVLLKGTKVDGVYTDDPKKNPNAVKYNSISFDEVIDNRLKVMDQTAFTMCSENKKPIIVFDMTTEGNLLKVLSEDESCGTKIHL